MPVILAIGAHPDDVELGLGGSLARYVEEGSEVHVLVLSRGERGVSDKFVDKKANEEIKENLKGKIREEETKDALTLLGVKERNITIFGLPDMGIEINGKVVEQVYQHIAKINPDVVYTHYFEDDHLDHVNTSLITLHAARKVKTILFYESPSTRATFSPNYFVDISDYIQKKVEALKKHKTQASKPYIDEKVVIARARFRGFQAKVKYAEGFILYKHVE